MYAQGQNIEIITRNAFQCSQFLHGLPCKPLHSIDEFRYRRLIAWPSCRRYSRRSTSTFSLIASCTKTVSTERRPIIALVESSGSKKLISWLSTAFKSAVLIRADCLSPVWIQLVTSAQPFTKTMSTEWNGIKFKAETAKKKRASNDNMRNASARA